MIRVVELFAGIGAQRMALMQAGVPFEVVAVSEINRHSIASYEAIYGDCPNLGDIRRVERLPTCDLLTYSFPCQDLSVAGKRGGMGEGTRSGLVWEVVRLLESERERPEWLLMENVPQVLTSPLWPDLLGRLEAMGYRNRWAKLDSSRFGSAQKRVRAFMVSRLGAEPPELPTEDAGAPALCLRDVMEPTREERYVKRIPLDRVRWREIAPKSGDSTPSASIEGETFYSKAMLYSSSSSPTVRTEHGKNSQIKVIADWQREGRLDLANRIYSDDGISPAMVCHGGGNREIKVFACSDDEGGLDQNIVPSKTFIGLGDLPLLASSAHRGLDLRGRDAPAFRCHASSSHGLPGMPPGGAFICGPSSRRCRGPSPGRPSSRRRPSPPSPTSRRG